MMKSNILRLDVVKYLTVNYYSRKKLLHVFTSSLTELYDVYMIVSEYIYH